MELTINGKKVQTTSLKVIGKGGEADVFDLGTGKVLKVFKTPTHPDYSGNPHEQKGAKERILKHQKKLLAFPKNLPQEVIAPIDLALNSKGEVAGYTMKFVGGADVIARLSEKSFRFGNMGNDVVNRIFLNLHGVVRGTHKASVVCGDFNDLNILFKGEQIFIIDADSAQFGQFLCMTFTQRFVDPTLCDVNASSPMLVKPHNENSDWYAFNVMLFMSLLYVDPFGGVYKPKDSTKRIPHSARSLNRITVFDDEVLYPKPATHWSVLPDLALQHFHSVFKKDKRGEFPSDLLKNLQWKQCSKCGVEHARPLCPVCSPQIGGIVKEKVIQTVSGKVTVSYILKTSGRIVFATYQHGIRFLVHENNSLRRETSEIIEQGPFDPDLRYKITGKGTVIGKAGRIKVFGDKARVLTADSKDKMPFFDANEQHFYWVQSGQLLRDGEFGGTEYLGDVLQDQTLFWVGETFGFGFYWAGMLRIAFIFDANNRGINDSVKLPHMGDQLISTRCYFAKDRCWFLWSAQYGSVRKNNCIVIKRDGSVIASSQAIDGDGTWLGTIGAKTAAGDFLLAATDEGIVQLKVDTGAIVETKRFPDTEPYVSTDCSLFAGSDGLYVVTLREILRLTISP